MNGIVTECSFTELDRHAIKAVSLQAQAMGRSVTHVLQINMHGSVSSYL